HYQRALDLFADLGESRRPRSWSNWRSAQARVQQLTVQLSQPSLQFTWEELHEWLQQLSQLQPNGSFQHYAGQWLQECQSAAEAMERSGRWDEAVTLLSGIPAAEQTPVMQQLLQQIEERVSVECAAAAELAAAGDYAVAAARLQQLPAGLRPAVLRQYQQQAQRVQELC
ncbi:MAG: hypothetical protein ACKPJD_03695, partial [Planctomycetaceae bacterium]